MRSATQLLRSIGSRTRPARILPSASISCFATGRPLTTTSTGTLRVLPMRARSRSQYGFWS